MNQNLLKHLKDIGYEKFTPIQEKSIPLILKGEDLIAKAKTGSGKTLCFSIGALEKLNDKDFSVQTLVLSPTRELSNQIADVIKKVAKYKGNIKVLTLCGGVPSRPQKESLKRGAHIIVGTPGRVLYHLKEGFLSVDRLNLFVLDEADKMLDMGFLEDIEKINDFLPLKKQVLMFSATYEENIQNLSKNIIKNLNNIISVDEVLTNDFMSEYFCSVKRSEKEFVLKALINKFKPKSLLVFSNTKLECEYIANFLDDYEPKILNSDYEQRDRDEILIMFENGSHPYLIATDVASRGLDIDDIDLVINFDLPRQKDVYTHRIGRTARSMKKGVAVSLYTEDEKDFLYEIKGDKKIEHIETSSLNDEVFNLDLEYQTIKLIRGKRDKIRAFDIVGSLCNSYNFTQDELGKIKILNNHSYIAIKKDALKKILNSDKIKIKGKYINYYLK